MGAQPYTIAHRNLQPLLLTPLENFRGFIRDRLPDTPGGNQQASRHGAQPQAEMSQFQQIP